MGDIHEFSLVLRTFLKAYRWRRIDPVPWTPLRKPLAEAKIALTDLANEGDRLRAAVAQILPSLPSGTTYLVRRMDPTVFPIIAYSLTSPTEPMVALRVVLASTAYLPAASE